MGGRGRVSGGQWGRVYPTPLEETWDQRYPTPRITKAGGTHPTRLLSCYVINFNF